MSVEEPPIPGNPDPNPPVPAADPPDPCQPPCEPEPQIPVDRAE